tara:strand:- start:99 stop:464 length:366 start_codon:yes stop_codon:yes gene_type:complete
MGKEDWTGFHSYSSYKNTKYYARGSRSRSSSPVPKVKHLEVLKYVSYNQYYVNIRHCPVYITEEQVQEINKMKLKQNKEIKKAIREAFLDSVDGLSDEDVDKIKENFADDLDEFIKSIIKV